MTPSMMTGGSVHQKSVSVDASKSTELHLSSCVHEGSITYRSPRRRKFNRRIKCLSLKLSTLSTCSGPSHLSPTKWHGCASTREENGICLIHSGLLDTSMASRYSVGDASTNVDAEPSFPPSAVELTCDQELTLMAVANQIVCETLEASEEFEAVDRRVDDHRWKLVKQRENMQIYRVRRQQLRDDERGSFYPERPQLYSVNEDALRAFFLDEWADAHNSATTADADFSSRSPSSSASSSTRELRRTASLYGDRSVLEASKPTRVPLVLGTGVVDGSIEDIAFGALASSDRMWQLRDQENKSVGLMHARILATIHEPTSDDPFRFLGVKWSCRAALQPIFRQRDFLSVESSGMAKDANGERVFYYLNHSIELQQVPEFSRRGIIRGKMSLCYIGRPADPQNPSSRTSVYCLGFLDGRGMAVVQIAAAVLGAAISSVCTVVETSYAKKLAWLVEYKQRGENRSLAPSPGSSNCECCSKRIASITNPFGARSQCGLCDRVRAAS